MPRASRPMLAQIGSGDPSERCPDWLYEIKWDGVRALCYIEDGQRAHGFAQRQRHGPPVSGAVDSAAPRRRAQTRFSTAKSPRSNERGAAQFRAAAAPHQRGRRQRDRRRSPAAIPSSFSLSICCISTATIFAGCRCIERKRLLKEILTARRRDPLFRTLQTTAKAGFEAAKQQGLEGIVGKKADSFYESRRSATG